MASQNTFHLSTAAAQQYEAQKVPSVFAPLAEATFDAIELPESVRALDVACGTGIVTKCLAQRLLRKSRIVGTDLNPSMIEVAKATMPDSIHTVEWFSCDVTALPLERAEFDLVFCQQGLQFFPDKPAALSEIHRVLTPTGRFVLTCWSAVSPLFQAVADSLKRHVSTGAAKKAVAPFSFRDGSVIATLLTDADFQIQGHTKLLVHRPLTPPQEAVRREMLASPYEGELMDRGDEVIELMAAEVEAALEEYREGETLRIPQEAHLFVVEKSASA